MIPQNEQNLKRMLTEAAGRFNSIRRQLSQQASQEWPQLQQQLLQEQQIVRQQLEQAQGRLNIASQELQEALERDHLQGYRPGLMRRQQAAQEEVQAAQALLERIRQKLVNPDLYNARPDLEADKAQALQEYLAVAEELLLITGAQHRYPNP